MNIVTFVSTLMVIHNSYVHSLLTSDLLEYAKLLGNSLLKDPHLIFPGTEWCGAGDIAENLDEVGPFNKTDACCRTHDMCQDVIEAGQTKHSLKNNATYTRLNCSCDDEFKACLKLADTPVAIIIGVTYFDVLRTKCFKNTYPVIKCTKHFGLLDKRCKE